MSALTKAGDWHEAKLRGARLPEHVLPGDVHCPLCGEPLTIFTDPHGEDPSETLGRCAACITVVGVDL